MILSHMRLYNFIGLVEKEDVLKTVGTQSWQSVLLDYIPYKAVTYAPGYLFSLGSANLSLPTTSIYGLNYVSGITVFRHDFESKNINEPLINVDQYFAGSIGPDKFAVYKTPPPIHHWLKLNDSIINEIPQSWEGFVRSMLLQKK